MKFKILTLLFLIISVFVFSQEIQFISEKTSEPLPRVHVFDEAGTLLTISSMEGKINVEDLKPLQENYALVYDNLPIGDLKVSELNRQTIKLDDKVKEIEPIVLKDNKNQKYLYLTGFFYSYVTVNGKINCYADGLVTYVFDNKTKEYISDNALEFRVFSRKDIDYESKSVSENNFRSSLKILEPKGIAKSVTPKKESKDWVYKEVSASGKDFIEYHASRWENKEKKLFGYSVTDMRAKYYYSFEKGAKKRMHDVEDVDIEGSFKIMHKTEDGYNLVKLYMNFHPTEISYGNDKKVAESVKYKTHISNYKTEYWLDSDFPNMQTVLNSVTKNGLVLEKNEAGK